MASPSRFRSLRRFNFRIWAVGALISNIGTWMQRTAQDWLVLTQLTHNSAAAVGKVMALQYGPHLLLLPLTGFGFNFPIYISTMAVSVFHVGPSTGARFQLRGARHAEAT